MSPNCRLVTTHDLYRCQDNKQQVDVAVLDFSKAFNTLPLGKLEFYGITGHGTGRTMSSLGCPKAQCWAPAVFPVRERFAQLYLRGHAYTTLHCLVYREIHSQHNRVQIWADLDAMSAWSARWGHEVQYKQVRDSSSRHRLTETTASATTAK